MKPPDAMKLFPLPVGAMTNASFPDTNALMVSWFFIVQEWATDKQTLFAGTSASLVPRLSPLRMRNFHV